MAKPAAGHAAETRAERAPAPGLLLGTAVLTLDGELPVEFLTPGDRIVTRSGARRLRGLGVERLARADLVRIGAGALGHDRPEAELVLGAGQPVLVRGWRAKALFGAAQALVPVARLVDGSYVRREARREAILFTLEFDRDEVIYAGGLELGCPAVTVPA